jgi:Protein of unknown function (DUF2934)
MKGVAMLDKVGAACVKTTVGVPGPKGRPTPFLNDIRDLAHKKWTAAGRPPGDCTRFWLEAEQEIRQVR